MSKENKENSLNQKQKEILLKILGIQNEAVESSMESINSYLREIYANNISIIHILKKNLK